MSKSNQAIRFPPDAERHKCPDCGRIVVLSTVGTLRVWHESPECPEWAAFMRSLSPDETSRDLVSVPADWKPS